MSTYSQQHGRTSSKKTSKKNHSCNKFGQCSVGQQQGPISLLAVDCMANPTCGSRGLKPSLMQQPGTQHAHTANRTLWDAIICRWHTSLPAMQQPTVPKSSAKKLCLVTQLRPIFSLRGHLGHQKKPHKPQDRQAGDASQRECVDHFLQSKHVRQYKAKNVHLDINHPRWPKDSRPGCANLAQSHSQGLDSAKKLDPVLHHSMDAPK
jgi:hypothetical protein